MPWELKLTGIIFGNWRNWYICQLINVGYARHENTLKHICKRNYK